MQTTQLSYVVLGLLPSLVWLIFYLKQDIHPEPKREILYTFIKGGAAALIAGGLETILIKNISILSTVYSTIVIFISVAFLEEILKYGAASKSIAGPETDEPIDVFEYMITAAMGFAAAENIILFFTKNLTFLDTFFVSSFRFIGATLLHALCSGIFGFFLTWTLSKKIKSRKLGPFIIFILGLATSTLLHALYNFSIIKTEGHWELLMPFIVISSSALLLSILLRKLKIAKII